VTQRAIDPSLPGLDTVIDRLRDATSRKHARTPYEKEISRALEYVLVDNLISLASTASMPQVRAVATHKLKGLMETIERRAVLSEESDAVSYAATGTYLAGEIKRFLDRPSLPAQRLALPEAPPGAPIGQPAMDWLRRVSGECGEER
jgi:hypothetical protein